jgi:hypothetical protein
MELKDIVAISGMGGLHHVIGRNRNGLIVESIDAQRKRFSTTLNQKISVLADIALFTNNEDARLAQVLKNIRAAEAEGLQVPDGKADNNTYKAFMEKALPEYDRERVYVSDMRKLAVWYSVLSDVLDFEKLDEVAEEGSEQDNVVEETRSKANSRNVPPPKAKVAPVKGPAGGKSKTSTPRKMGS